MKRYLALLALLLLIGTASAATYTTNFTAAAAGDARMSWTSTPYDYLSVLRSLPGTAYDASMFVTSEQISALIRLGQAREHATPVRGTDP